MKVKYLQFIITIGALSIAAVHVKWPTLTIDGITTTLVFIALIPWLAPLFKSLEFPGGWKIEFKDFEQTSAKADKAGLLADSSHDGSDQRYSFQLVAEDDPKLALAGLRIEIEKRLTEIAEAGGIQAKRASVSGLLRVLGERDRLTQEQRSVLADMVGLLNAAVHGGHIDARATAWALDVGPRLLDTLEAKARA